jgi:hypothetical protein
MKEMDEALKEFEELVEIEDGLENLNIAASSTSHVESPYSDGTWTLDENPIGESYVRTPVSSDVEDMDWKGETVVGSECESNARLIS